MNATIYWTTQRLQRRAQEFRWAAQLWWLNRQVEFVGWRYRLEALLPTMQAHAVSPLIGREGPHAMQVLPAVQGWRSTVRPV
jgi:hypothetical protein